MARCRPYARRIALASLATLVLAGCAGPDESDEATSGAPSSATSTPTSTPSVPADTDATASASTEPPAPSATSAAPAGPALEVTIEGDEVTPNATEIDLAVGEPLTITFNTDRGGELHVHSKPEQYVEFEAGRSTQELVVQTPGSVEIEEHDTEAVVAVVEVR